jgi:DNA sulfur modification protein DndC
MQKVDRTINTIKGKLLEGKVMTLGVSGKDSFCVLHCTIEALKQAQAINPKAGPVCMVTTDTTMENPEIHAFMKTIHQEAMNYAEEFGLNLESHFLRPSLLTQPLVEYIGRGKLLRTPQNSVNGRDCAVNWKISPMKSFLRELSERFQTNQIISMSGSRDDESVVRANNLAKRGESIDTVSITDMGYTLSPIKDFSLNDVWSLIGAIEEDRVESFGGKCAKGLRRHYASANSGTCDIFAGKAAVKAACGARFGCWGCSMTKEDKSLTNQIETDKIKYGYMQPLNDFRNYMFNTLNDMELSRSLIGRDQKAGGWVKIGYNQYNMAYRQNLLRFALTIDYRHKLFAEENNTEPKFTLVDYQTLIAIQYCWSKEGGEATAASAFQIFHDVHTQGNLYDIPKTDCASLSGYEFSLSEARFLGGDKLAEYRYLKLDDIEHRLCSLDHGRDGLRMDRAITNKANAPRVMEDDGSITSVVPFTEGKRFSVVDPIAAERFVEDEYLDLVDLGLHHQDEYECIDPTEFLKIMLHKGIVSIKKGQIKKLHNDTKRAQFVNAIVRSGRHFEYVFLAHSISEEAYKATLHQHVKVPNAPQMSLALEGLLAT